MSGTGWGASAWGLDAWGGPSSAALTLLGAVAVRENVVRLAFSQPVYVSTLLDRFDGSKANKYAIAPNLESVDAVGVPPRAVGVIAVEVPNAASVPPVLQAEIGYFIDLVLDRPLSSHPAIYTVTVTELRNKTQTQTLVSASAAFVSLFREVQKPSLEVASEVRDFAMPQTVSALTEAEPDFDSTRLLGTYAYAEGDYAFDVGNTGRKKRVLRRLITRKGGFAHLPNYGLGILDQVKKLGTLDRIGKLTSDARLQIEREPDISKALVTASQDQKPNLLRLHIAIKPQGTPSQKFTVSLPIR